MRAILLPIAAILTFTTSASAFDTSATAAWVYDVNTSTVLMEKNADTPIPPASMSKLMTLYMLFEALEHGRLEMDTTLPVSTKARKMGGLTMFLNEMDRPTVEQLIKGIIVLSGNDACIVVAEGLAGSEEAFARQMTKRAKEIGLTQSTFRNSTGMPDKGHRMSAEDLGILARQIITQFPEYYSDFALSEYGFDDRAPANRFNRNPLLYLNIGADGMKTGHTAEAGYSLVGSAKQDERRVIFVVSGLGTDMARAVESERIVNWAFRNFKMHTVVTAGQAVAEAPVWLGTIEKVGLVTKDKVSVLIPTGTQDDVKREVVYHSPVPAPLSKGDKVGDLVVTVPGSDDIVVPLLAAADVPEAGFGGRMKAAVFQLGNRAMTAALEAAGW